MLWKRFEIKSHQRRACYLKPHRNGRPIPTGGARGAPPTLTRVKYFIFCKWAPFKMQKMIEQAGPSRQLFEAVNFAFMKIFHFLVKIAIFRVFLLFSERFSSCISARIKYSSQNVYGRNAWRKSPEKKEKCPKNGYFD